MSLQYALHLTASEQQDLTRIAQGRGGRRRPPLWQAVRARALLKCDAGPQGAGWTDEAVAAALSESACDFRPSGGAMMLLDLMSRGNNWRACTSLKASRTARCLPHFLRNIR